MNKPLRIGIVAGEISGDLLGADLIAHIRQQEPEATFSGLGGERMIAQGFTSLFPMERLSVMGFVDPLKRLPELLRIRKSLYKHFLDNRFDLVLGIDSPDFNLGLELKLRRKGMLTAHYVSPSVWAWRQGRVKKIARAVDRMLTLLPFEADFYQQHRVPVSFVGHPLADQIPLTVDKLAARRELGLGDGLVLAVMPGSRRGEIALMCRLFLHVAENLVDDLDGLQVVIPAANLQRHQEIETILQDFPNLPATLVQGKSHTAMAAADAVLLTSGTTALEAMLLKKPMVVAYRMGELSYKLASRLVKTPHISLPNLIAGEKIVPEMIQSQANVDSLTIEMKDLLVNSERRDEMISTFFQLHANIRKDASSLAAKVLLEMIGDRHAG